MWGNFYDKGMKNTKICVKLIWICRNDNYSRMPEPIMLENMHMVRTLPDASEPSEENGWRALLRYITAISSLTIHT